MWLTRSTGFNWHRFFIFSDLDQKSVALKEKQHAISDMMSEIQEKDTEKEKIIQKIENLKEEQIKRKESKTLGSFVND